MALQSLSRLKVMQTQGCSPLGTAVAAKNVSPAAGVSVTGLADGNSGGDKPCSVLGTGFGATDLITNGNEAV